MASLLKGGPTSAYNEIGTHEMDPMIERVLLLKQEAFVYKIPQNQVCHGMQIHTFGIKKFCHYLEMFLKR